MSTIDSGHTSWLIISTALVQLMTPGLALFYGGLVGRHNVLAIFQQNFAAMGLITMLWMIFLFSGCFGNGTAEKSFMGSYNTYPFYKDVKFDKPLPNADGVPGLLFAAYQGMFAVITPCLMTGAFVDRMHFFPYLIFISVWMFLVYVPWCHMIWGGGLLVNDVSDFAGGIVVHVTAGFSALAAVIWLGPRESIVGKKHAKPHNIPFVAMGTGLLWFGWFGFNGGSALSSGPHAALAAVNSEVSASVAMFTWAMLEWVRGEHPGVVGLCTGAIAGLATITPCAGYIPTWAAFIVGIMAAFFCMGCVEALNMIEVKADDALDVWGVHGMGGFLGTCLIGVFADRNYSGINRVHAGGEVFGKQLGAAVVCAVYSMAFTFIILQLEEMVLKQFGLTIIPTAEEQKHIDEVEDGERAYTGDSRDKSRVTSPEKIEIEMENSGNKNVE